MTPPPPLPGALVLDHRDTLRSWFADTNRELAAWLGTELPADWVLAGDG